MNSFIPTTIAGLTIVEPHHFTDQRGWFIRGFHADDFAREGLTTEFKQSNISFNIHAGTLRGLHFQYPPQSEAKLIRCTRGAIYDVVVDLRPESFTYMRWRGEVLCGSRMLHIPSRCAHAYQSLESDTEVHYLLSELFSEKLEMGICFNDPRLDIKWPLRISNISEKDRRWPLLNESEPEIRERMSL